MDIIGYDCLKQIFYYSEHKDLIQWRLTNKKVKDIIDNLQFTNIDSCFACENNQYLIIKKYIETIVDYKLALKCALICLYKNFNIKLFILFTQKVFKLTNYSNIENIKILSWIDFDIWTINQDIGYKITDKINFEVVLTRLNVLESKDKTIGAYLSLLFIGYQQILRTFNDENKPNIEKIGKLISIFDSDVYINLGQKYYIVYEFLNFLHFRNRYKYYLLSCIIKSYYNKSVKNYSYDEVLDIVSYIVEYDDTSLFKLFVERYIIGYEEMEYIKILIDRNIDNDDFTHILEELKDRHAKLEKSCIKKFIYCYEKDGYEKNLKFYEKERINEILNIYNKCFQKKIQKFNIKYIVKIGDERTTFTSSNDMIIYIIKNLMCFRDDKKFCICEYIIIGRLNPNIVGTVEFVED